MFGNWTNLVETALLTKVEIGIIKAATIKARSCWLPDSRSLNLKKGLTEASWYSWKHTNPKVKDVWKKHGAEMEITRYRDQLYSPGRQNEMPSLEDTVRHWRMESRRVANLILLYCGIRKAWRMESDRKPKNLILVWGTGTDLERPMKYSRRTKTEHTIKAAASASWKLDHLTESWRSRRKASWPTWRSSIYWLQGTPRERIWHVAAKPTVW